MLAITTRYRGPTDVRGSRIVATCAGKRATVPYDSALEGEENHRVAVIALCERLGWDHMRFFGANLRGGTYVWVPVFNYDWEKRHTERQHEEAGRSAL